jgi:hypothetical protein
VAQGGVLTFATDMTEGKVTTSDSTDNFQGQLYSSGGAERALYNTGYQHGAESIGITGLTAWEIWALFATQI